MFSIVRIIRTEDSVGIHLCSKRAFFKRFQSACLMALRPNVAYSLVWVQLCVPLSLGDKRHYPPGISMKFYEFVVLSAKFYVVLAWNNANPLGLGIKLHTCLRPWLKLQSMLISNYMLPCIVSTRYSWDFPLWSFTSRLEESYTPQNRCSVC
jgi:hypothetical protein